jgi:acetaldehyde dehydrogenase (acetylating)
MPSNPPPASHPWRKVIRDHVYVANLRNRRDAIEASIKHLRAELAEVKKKLEEVDK